MIAVFFLDTLCPELFGISTMDIARGLRDTTQYLESASSSGVSQSAFGKMKAQQLTLWCSRINAAKLNGSEAKEVIAAVQEGKWTEEEKDQMLGNLHFQPDVEAQGSGKIRPRQEMMDFVSFLRRSDVQVLQNTELSWVSKMDHIAEVLVQLSVHLPTEKTMGHVLENLSLNHNPIHAEATTSCMYIYIYGSKYIGSHMV